MKFGYARVSIHDQHRDALEPVDCERIFTGNDSGATVCANRPQLQQLRDQLRAGAVLVIWKLDRLDRNLRDLLTFVSDLEGDGIELWDHGGHEGCEPSIWIMCSILSDSFCMDVLTKSGARTVARRPLQRWQTLPNETLSTLCQAHCYSDPPVGSC